MFKERVKDLGEIRPYSKNDIVFKNVGYNGDIVRVKASCGCSQASFDRASGDVRVSYRAEAVPVHLRDRGWYDVAKSVTVSYLDGRSEVLMIRARVQGA